MALFEILDRSGVPYNRDDVVKRVDILVKGLRGDPTYESEMESYTKQRGGAEPTVKPSHDDYLGPQMRWFVEALGSPYAQTAIRVVFMVVFFVSYLESIPAFGSILSAALDITVMGGKMLVKTVQSLLPNIIGLIPLPYTNFLGMGVAAVFGLILWPLLAIVSFSRQDFTAAIDSFIRVMPPPLGNTIADLFLEGNRTVYRLNEKRQKLASDISGGLSQLMNLVEGSSSTFRKGATVLSERTKEVAGVQSGGIRLSKKRKTKHKWRTHRQKLRK